MPIVTCIPTVTANIWERRWPCWASAHPSDTRRRIARTPASQGLAFLLSRAGLIHCQCTLARRGFPPRTPERHLLSEPIQYRDAAGEWQWTRNDQEQAPGPRLSRWRQAFWAGARPWSLDRWPKVESTSRKAPLAR